MAMQSAKEERSLGELFADLARETSTLIRQEVSLAKTEMSQKAGRIGRHVAFLAAGGAVAYAGFLALLAALIIGLATLGLDWWLAALLVGLLVAAIGYFLVQTGINALRRESLAPQQTLETLKEDAEWAKEQVR
jgi:hypothetical protein